MRSSLFPLHFFDEHSSKIETLIEDDLELLKAAYDQISFLFESNEANIRKLNEAQLEATFLRPVFECLGHVFEVQTTSSSTGKEGGAKSIDYAFFESEESREEFRKNKASRNWMRYSYCSTICEVKAWDKLNGHDAIKRNDNSDPIYQLKICYLDSINPRERKATVPYGILTDGKHWRIYSNKSDPTNFIEIDLEAVLQSKNIETFRIFWLLFSRNAFSGPKYVSTIEKNSRNIQSAVSDELRRQVFSSLELIANGIYQFIVKNEKYSILHQYKQYREIKNTSANTAEENEKALIDIIYGESLVYLFRLLFILFAEHRGLLQDKKLDFNFYRLLDQIKEHSPRSIGAVNTSAHELNRNYDRDLLDIFKSINEKYNGGIFSPELHPLLGEIDIDNIIYANAIDFLTRTYDPETKNPVRVDFSTLDVRHLGTIYEGLLEFKLKKATADIEIPDLFDIKRQKSIHKNELFLVNDQNERKSSGSYYTPDYIVEYITRNSLGAILEKIENNSERYIEKIESILSIKIADPAMGSGHFLVESIRQLEDSIQGILQDERRTLLEMPANPSQSAGLSQIDIEFARITNGTYKRIIARRCIYGVDKNPMAVELAKLSIWLFTLQKDKKLEFFDYNLRHGDSLIGTDQAFFTAARSKGKSSQFTYDLFATDQELKDEIISDFRDLFGQYFVIDEVEEKRAFYFGKIVPAQTRLRYLANLDIAERLLPKSDLRVSTIQVQYNRLLKRLQSNPSYFTTISDRSDLEPWEQEIDSIVQELRHDYKPIHWEIEFPNVFMDGGFDVVLGNPPYDVLSDKESEIKHLPELKNFIEKHNILRNSIRGKNNLYKLFTALGISLVKPDGMFSFIVPMPLLGDEQATTIRKYMFGSMSFLSIDCFPQKDDPHNRVFEDAKLSTCIFVAEKSNKLKNFTIRNHPGKDFLATDAKTLKLNARNVSSFSPEKLIVPSCEAKDWVIIKRILEDKSIGRMADIAEQYQGEINETTQKGRDTLTKDPTYIKILRGANITMYAVRESSQGEDLWLNDIKYLKNKKSDTKAFHHRLKRIGFQRSSPQNNFRRIIAAPIEKGLYCFDTVSYVTESSCEIDLMALLAFLNSTFLDWYFRLTSTNSKVNEYQFNDLPMPMFSLQPEPLSVEAALQSNNFPDLINSIVKGSDGNHPQWILRVLADLANKIHIIELNRELKSRSERSQLSPEAAKYQRYIDTLIFRLYSITEKQQRYIEKRQSEML